MPFLSYFFFMFLGFISGSIFYSYLVPKWFCRVDITEHSADGNPGAFNAVKYAGWKVGMACVLLDLAKGFLPVFFAMRFLDFTNWWFAPVLSAPVFGHAFSPFWKCRGGKAIAVSFGALLGLLPHATLVFSLASIYIILSVIFVVNPHRARSIATYAIFAAVCVQHYWVNGSIETSILCGCLLICTIVIGKHLKPEGKEKFQLQLLPALFAKKN